MPSKASASAIVLDGLLAVEAAERKIPTISAVRRTARSWGATQAVRA